MDINVCATGPGRRASATRRDACVRTRVGGKQSESAGIARCNVGQRRARQAYSRCTRSTPGEWQTDMRRALRVMMAATLGGPICSVNGTNAGWFVPSGKSQGWCCRCQLRSCVESVTAAMHVDMLDSGGFSTMVNEFTLSLREAIRASCRENRERSFEAEGPWNAGGPSVCRPHR
jgi:hypothetical protein